MAFISYAQIQEDVMLNRALKHIDKGLYIDVGAWSPDIDSVTRAFYDEGWTGINVEPNPAYHRELKEMRPDDINLQCAVGDHEGVESLHILGDTGLATLDVGIATRHSEVCLVTESIEVEVITLAMLWDRYIQPDQQVHFLKIDVEGYEKKVVAGNNWSINRPWIIVIEATAPMSNVEMHYLWQEVLLTNNYLFAYSDGVNRFYVSKEKLEYLELFRYPPNPFDYFISNKQLIADRKLAVAQSRLREATIFVQTAQEAEIKAQEAEIKSQEAEIKSQEAEIKAQEAEIKAQEAVDQAQVSEIQSNQNLAELQAVFHSRSWRFTAPLRKISRALRWLVGGVPVRMAMKQGGRPQRIAGWFFPRVVAWITFQPDSRPRRIAGWFFPRVVAWITFQPDSRPRRIALYCYLSLRNWILDRPRVESKVKALLNHFPKIKAVFLRVHHSNPRRFDVSYFLLPSVSSAAETVSNLRVNQPRQFFDLTPRGRQIFVELKNEIRRYKQSQ